MQNSGTPIFGRGASVPWEVLRSPYDGLKTGEADNLASRIGGINMALRRLELDKTHDIAKYAKQIEDIGDQPSIGILGQVLQNECEHYQVLNNLIRNRRPLPPFSPDQAGGHLGSERPSTAGRRDEVTRFLVVSALRWGNGLDRKVHGTRDPLEVSTIEPLR